MSAPCPTLGFRLAFSIDPGASDARRAAVRDAFMSVIAASGLTCEAAHDAAFAWTVTGDGTQATESDRARIVEWLEQQPEIAGSRVGPLTDLAAWR
jgi:uncharacterized protein YggL (DUF469 family)